MPNDSPYGPWSEGTSPEMSPSQLIAETTFRHLILLSHELSLSQPPAGWATYEFNLCENAFVSNLGRSLKVVCC